MTETQPSTAAWLDAQRAQRVAESPAQLLARQAELEKQREETAKIEAELTAQDTADKRALAFRAAGLTAGRTVSESLAEAARVGDEDQEYDNARATIERIEKRRARRAEVARDQMERLAIARSAAPSETDLLGPAKATLREHAEFVARSRAAWAAASAPREPRPPSGGPGSVVRSEPVSGGRYGREITRVCTPDRGNVAWPS
jgi:hypothetical protein